MSDSTKRKECLALAAMKPGEWRWCLDCIGDDGYAGVEHDLSGTPHVKPCDDCYTGKCSRHICKQCGRAFHGFYTHGPVHECKLREVQVTLPREDSK